MSSRFQDRTEGLKFQNPKPGWKAKSVAQLVYRDSSGQTSYFPVEILITVVVVAVAVAAAVAVAVAVAVVVAVVVVAAAAVVVVVVVVVVAHNENSHENTGVVSTMIRTTSPYSQHDDMIVLR